MWNIITKIISFAITYPKLTQGMIIITTIFFE